MLLALSQEKIGFLLQCLTEKIERFESGDQGANSFQALFNELELYHTHTPAIESTEDAFNRVLDLSAARRVDGVAEYGPKAFMERGDMAGDILEELCDVINWAGFTAVRVLLNREKIEEALR